MSSIFIAAAAVGVFVTVGKGVTVGVFVSSGTGVGVGAKVGGTGRFFGGIITWLGLGRGTGVASCCFKSPSSGKAKPALPQAFRVRLRISKIISVINKFV